MISKDFNRFIHLLSIDILLKIKPKRKSIDKNGFQFTYQFTFNSFFETKRILRVSKILSSC